MSLRKARTAALTAITVALMSPYCHAWGRDGHMMINRLAAQFLPADVPAFMRNGEALDTMEYLGPEPDRWKGKAEQELSDTQSPDHFLDYEWAIYGAKPCTEAADPNCVAGYDLPRRRYDFLRALAAAQPAHPDIKLQENVGLQPWQVEEVWQRLKIDFREFRRLRAANQDTRPDEIACLYDAGWLGHYVADGSQPLHITIRYNGWVGPNPNGYSTDHSIHSKFESVYVSANIHRDTDVAPLVAASKPQVIDHEWVQYLNYIHHSNTLVEQVYQLDKTGAFDGAGTPAGKAFVDAQLAAGAVELRDLIYSAWVHSADPVDEFRGPQ